MKQRVSYLLEVVVIYDEPMPPSQENGLSMLEGALFRGIQQVQALEPFLGGVTVSQLRLYGACGSPGGEI